MDQFDMQGAEFVFWFLGIFLRPVVSGLIGLWFSCWLVKKGHKFLLEMWR